MNPAVEIDCKMLKRKREEEENEYDNISKLSKLNSSFKKSDESVGENGVSSDAEHEQIVSTTLQDLPVEILDMILMKTLSLEIISQNLPRSTASEITVNVLTELRTVWSEWNSRLTTKWFKIMFQRQLKRLGSVEYKSSPDLIDKIEPQDMVLAKGSPITGMTILDKELFIKRLRSASLEVYDSIDYSFKRILRFVDLDYAYPSVTHSGNMMSCKLNRCLYLVNLKVIEAKPESEIIRFSLDGKLVSHWSVRDYYVEMSISNEGNIIVLVAYVGKLMEYSPGGELIREMTLDVNLDDLHCKSHAVKLKNGQFVVSTWSKEHSLCILDSNGSVVKSFSRRKSFVPSFFVVDEEESIIIADSRENRVFLVSSSLEYKKEILSQEQYGKDKVRILLDEPNGRLLVARFVSDKYAQVCIFKIR